MDVPYDNYQQNYGYDARQYDAEVAGNGSYSNNEEPHAPGTGIDYGRDRREVDYNRGPGGGRGNDYGYDGRGMGDRGGGNPAYQREGSREYDRFSDSYDDSASNSSRDRDRERDRDRSRRDRDRRDRHRPRDRDHERSRERRERRDRDRSPSGRYDDYGDGDDSYRDRDRDGREAREDRGGEKWMTDTPTNTILLRGLPSQVDEKDIRAELMMFGAPVKDVRLMRRSTGASRGFAFVEFQNVTDAQRWMDQKQGLLNMLNQYSVTMHYSTPRVGPEKFVQHKTDWTCSKCGVHNFKRRDYCFKCNISRDESDKTKDGDGFDQVGTNPCNTLIFRGLDALTTEESLDAALRLQTNLQSKNVRIIRDPVTNTSRGYGFCEMNSIQESTQVLDYLSLNNVPLEVDGKQVLVAYAKNTFSTVMATLNSSSQQGWDYATQQAAVQQGSDFYSQQQYYIASGTTTAVGEYDPATGQYYNQATGQYYDGQSYDYSQYYAQQGAGLQTDTTNAAAAVAQAAIAQANAAKNYNRQNSGPKKSEASTEQATTTTVDGKDYPVYPPPDVSTYQFDKSSGYYYDSTTGLYYDANSQFDCPVEDCDVSLIWHKLRNHWLYVHEPTITSYTCPLPTCQFKRDKKTSGKYNHKVNFLCHLNKVHGKVGSQCDLIINMAKVETNKNPDYFDPGFLLCPQPKQVPEPPKLLEMDVVVKDTAVEDTLKTAPEPTGKPIASFTKTNVSATQKKKLTIAEQRSSLVVIKTTSSKPQVPSTPKWIFGTSKKRRKKKNATETTSEPQKLIKVQKPSETPIESQPGPKKKMPQPQQEKMTKSEKIQQKKMVAAKMRAELIAQETEAPVPELYDPTPAKEKEKLARPLLKLKLKISTPIIKQQQIVKTKCPVKDCSDDFEAKYSEKLKHYYLVHVQNHFQCPECQSNFGYPDFNVHMKTEHDYSDEKLGDLENVAVTNENFIDPGSHVSYFFEPEAGETPTEDDSRKEDTVTAETSPSSIPGIEPSATAVETESLFVEGDSSKEGVVGSRSHGNILGLEMTASEKDVAEKSDQRKLPTSSVAEDTSGEMTRKEHNVDVASDSSSRDEGERSSAVHGRIIESSEKAAGKDSAMTTTSVSKDSLKPDGKATNLTKGKSGNSQANPFHEKYSYYPFKCPVPRCQIVLKSGSDRVDHYEKFHHRFCYRCKFCGQFFQRNLFRSHLKKDHMMNFGSINVCLQNCQTKNPLYINPKKYYEFFRTGIIEGIRPNILPEAVQTFSFEDEIKSTTASTSSEARSDLEKTYSVMQKNSGPATHSDTQTGEKIPLGDGSSTTEIAFEVDNPSKKAASVSMPCLTSTNVSLSSDATSVKKDALQNEPGKEVDEKDAIYPIKCPVPRCSVNLCSKQLRVDHYEISHYKFLFKCHLCSKTLQRRVFRTHLKTEHKLNVSKEVARIVRIPNPHYVDPGPFEEFLDKGFLKHAEIQKYLASCKSTESNKSSSTSDVQGKSSPENTELVMKKDITTRSETQPEEKHLLGDENTIKESAREVSASTSGKGAVGINMPSLLLTQTSVSSDLSEKSSQNEPEEQSLHLKDNIYPMKCPVPRCFINLRSDKQRLDHFEISHYKFLFQCHLCHKTCQRRLFRPHLQDDHNLDLGKEGVKETEVPNPHYVDPGLFKDFLAKEILDDEDKQSYLASCGSAESNISKIYPMKCPVPRCLIHLQSDKQRVDHFEISHFRYLFQCHFCHKNFQRKLYRPHLKNAHNLHVDSITENDHQTPNPHYVDPGLFQEFLEKGILKDVDKQKYLASFGSAESDTSSSISGIQGKFDPEKTESFEKEAGISTCSVQQTDESSLGSESSTKESAKEGSTSSSGEKGATLDEKDNIYPMKCPVPRCFIKLRSDKQRVDHYEISHYKFLFLCHLCHRSFQRKLIRPHLQDDHNLDVSREAVKEVRIPNPHYVDPGLFEEFLEQGVLEDVDKQKYLASCGAAGSKTTSRSGVQGKVDPQNTDSSEKKKVDSSICSDAQAEIKTVPEKESSIEKSTTKFVLSSMEENAESQCLDEKDKSVTEESQVKKIQNTKPDGNEGISSDVKSKNATEESLLENSAIEDVEKAGKTTTNELDPLCSDKKLESETVPEEDYPGETLSPEGRDGTEHTTEKDKSTKADDQAGASRDLSTEGTSSEVPVPSSLDEVKQIAEYDTSAGVTSEVDSTLTTISTAADAPQSLQSSLSTDEKKNAEEPIVKAPKPAVTEKGATIPRRVTRSVSSIPSSCKDSSHAQVESKSDATTGSDDAKNKNTSLSKDCLKSITTVHSVRPNLLTIQTVNDYTPAAKLSFSPASIMTGKKVISPALAGQDSLIKNVSTSSSDKIDKRTPDKVTQECSTKETNEKVMTKNDKNETIMIGEDDSVTRTEDLGATAPHTKPVTETVSDNKTKTGDKTAEEKNIGITNKEFVKSNVTEKNTNDDGKSMKVVSPISIATVHSVRPNLVAIKTVEDFRTSASSSLLSATIMTKKEESPALTREQSSVKVPAKSLKTKEKNVPPVVEKMHFSEKNKIYPLKCPVPKCQFNIKCGTERVDHFEKIHYKYYFGCNICGGIFQKKLFRPHQRNDHYMARTGTLDEAKIPNPFFVDPGNFLQFFKTGILEGFNYKSNQGYLAIDSMSKVETKSKSQKTVFLTKKTSEDDKKTDELKKSTKESKGKSPQSTETKVEPKRKPESSRSKTKSTEGIHKSTRSRRESTRRQSRLTESRQSSRNKPQSMGSKSETKGSKPTSTGSNREMRNPPKAKDSKHESIGSKPGSAESKQKSTGSKQESSGSKPESTESKAESTERKTESTESKPESAKRKTESTESKPDSAKSKPESTGSKQESSESKPKSTGSKRDLTESKPESAKSKSGSTGSKQELSGSKPESTGSKTVSTEGKPESTGGKPESTESKPESTESKPESPRSKPESTGSKPKSSGSKPDPDRSESKATGSKLKNTPDSKKSQHEHKTKADDTKKGDDKSRRAGHDSNLRKSDLRRLLSEDRKRRVEKESDDKSKRLRRNDHPREERKGTERRTASRGSRHERSRGDRDKPLSSDERKRKIDVKSKEDSKRLRRDDSREERKGSKHDIKQITDSVKSRHESESRKTDSKGSTREPSRDGKPLKRHDSKEEKSERSSRRSLTDKSKKLPYIKPKVIYASEPCSKLPKVGDTEDELMWFLSWTDEYIVKLEEAHRDAEKQLKDINP